MTSEQFAYWFQGFAELSETPPTQAQWDSMREHVSTVFKKVTPLVRVDVTPVGPGVFGPGIADEIRKLSEQGRPHITC